MNCAYCIKLLCIKELGYVQSISWKLLGFFFVFHFTLCFFHDAFLLFIVDLSFTRRYLKDFFFTNLNMTCSRYITQSIYRILQIVRGGKVSRMDKLVPICWKTFAVCQLHENVLMCINNSLYTRETSSFTTTKLLKVQWWTSSK